MLKNYFEIDENETVKSFLKEVKDKKNSQYIILNTTPKTFIDIRTIALKKHNLDEKLKNLKKPLAQCVGNSSDDFMIFLIESGDRVIQTQNGYYDFTEALKNILNHKFEFLNSKLNKTTRKEIFALNNHDKISDAKALFVKKKVNLLPVIEKKEVIGELRPMDFLVTSLTDTSKNKADYYNKSKQDLTLNLSIKNLTNKKPLILDTQKTYKDAIELMIKKTLPSMILTHDNELYSIVSYKDIFKLTKKDLNAPKYLIEYIGKESVYEDEFALIQEYANKSMQRITTRLRRENLIYDTLKIVLKSHGNVDGTHQRKIEVKITLSVGSRTLSVTNEIVAASSNENRNKKLKIKWNPAQLVQTTLKTLENKVLDEKKKKK